MPVAASACMAALLAFVRTEDLFLIVLYASTVYTATLVLIACCASGGPRRLTARYTFLRLE
jgi:hypothetical protein